MLRVALGLFVLALAALILGVYGIAGVTMDIVKFFIFTFLILAMISIVGALISGRNPNQLR